jgi:hypothetical protein
MIKPANPYNNSQICRGDPRGRPFATQTPPSIVGAIPCGRPVGFLLALLAFCSSCPHRFLLALLPWLSALPHRFLLALPPWFMLALPP